MRIATAGHAVFAATMIALGVMGLIKGDFTVVWEPVPKDLPAREAVAYLCAIISLASGIGLLWRRAAAFAARALLTYLLLWLLLFRLPGFFRTATVEVYWPACRTGVLIAAAWVLYVWFATNWDKKHLSFATGEKGSRLAQILYGLALIPFGVAHFTYLKQTTPLVPGWLPWHVAWAYLTGGTFIAAGAAIVTGVLPRMAAALSTLQIGLFLLLVWVPRVAEGSVNAFQWSETVVSWVLAAAAWVVTDSYRDISWVRLAPRHQLPAAGCA